MLLKRKFPRSSGVLMPLPSLHGPFGIGVMGAEAYEFIDFLVSAGFHAWQVLPVEQARMYCSSPYSCLSAFAGEPMLIDPRMLLTMGLITEDELAERMLDMSDSYIEYEIIRNKQLHLLRIAFSRRSRQHDAAYKEYNPFWLDEYALFISLKHFNDLQAWYQWEDEGLRSHDEKVLSEYRKEHGEDIEFHKFVQWLFYVQWETLRTYAAERGISIIGDMPIYLADDSAEVWSRRELFNAGADGKLESIGGVPPDYFSPTGQRWGNPIYNWDLMKKDKYRWWINRLRASLRRYDVVRLDHFRGFESYWRIPGGAKTAKRGKWTKGPGIELFRALERSLGKLSLSVIAEDLGFIGKDVVQLISDTGFRCMRVLQFAFDDEGVHMPHNLPEESVAYTGTHDNTTMLAWLFSLDPEERERVLFYTNFQGDWTVGGPNCGVLKAWMHTLFMTRSSIIVVPIQDLLGYGADTRINTPGTPSGNWRFRIREGVLYEIDAGFYTALHKAYQREDQLKKYKPRKKKEKSSPKEYERTTG
ncbi:MAG: 4-alpha-glucanotransferase [Oscillospiraceae bacterium]|nr:4-alpha-glucanotransferase [Oscillospiraceae bacterium]